MMEQIGKFLDECVNDIQEAANTPTGTSGLSSGLKDLDRVLHGFENSDLIVVGARPAMGKTGFLLSLAINMAKQGIPVLFYSLEMSNKHIIRRIISNTTGIDGSKISSGQLTQDDWTTLFENFQSISGYPIYLSDKPAWKIEDFRVEVHNDIKATNAKVVFIDYLQLMSSHENLQNRYEEVALCTRELKQLAHDLNVPVIVSSQLNRKVETRPSGSWSEKIPLMHDLRDSGTICDDANVVLLLHRPEYYLQRGEDESGNDIRGLAEVIIAKNHMGPTDTVKLKFTPQTGKFEDWPAPSYFKDSGIFDAPTPSPF